MLDPVAMVFSWLLFERGLDSIQELVNRLISHRMDTYVMTCLVKIPNILCNSSGL